MNCPKIQFPEFQGTEWKPTRIDSVLRKVTKPVSVDPEQYYVEIGIKSHGRGIFHKEPVLGRALGNKRVFWVEENALVLNIVFAWEQAIAVTTASQQGLIASHRFPMYLPKNDSCITSFLCYVFLTKKGKRLLELASPGGAGRNKTLGQKNFDELVVHLPSSVEQAKIASFLTAIDQRITQLNQKCDLLVLYKKGAMQQIFSQELRFKDDDGQDFPAWENKKAGDIFANVVNRNHNSDLPVLTATQERGMIFRDESGLDIKASDESIKSYKIVESGDFVISLRSFQGGIEYSSVKGICSPAYTVMKPKLKIVDGFFKAYLKKDDFIRRLNGLMLGIRDGKQISYGSFSSLTLPYPCIKEQLKIAAFLSTLDEKITITKAQLAALLQYRQGLLQQMFA